MSKITEITITVRKSDIELILHECEPCSIKCWKAKVRVGKIVERNSQDTHASACHAAGANAGAK